MNEINEFITNISYFLLFVLGLKVIIFVSASHLHYKKQKAFRNNYREEFNPFVSVIVPCYNEENKTTKSMKSLL
jgi:cellulose synthase/poly-beta-1,6-N-acetylglucosamine synthase-like glycosyltransferase